MKQRLSRYQGRERQFVLFGNFIEDKLKEYGGVVEITLEPDGYLVTHVVKGKRERVGFLPRASQPAA